MYLSRIQIKNFRNFQNLDVSLNGNAVIIGENKVGKSNFLFALRLVLDISLPDSARELKLTDFWDGLETSKDHQIEVHLDFSDFEKDVVLTALLTDYRLKEDHTIARLSYVFKKKSEVTGIAQSEVDFEHLIFGANDETRGLSYSVRKKICIEILHALRDAETELGNWKNSPLRPLLDDAVNSIPQQQKETVTTGVTTAISKVTEISSIQTLENSLTDRISSMTGKSQDVNAKFGIAPTDPQRLFRSIRMLIDDGKRTIGDASLGSANLMLLTLKLAEYDWLRQKNAQNFTIVCVEEPEAHLHPHLQRSVFKKLLSESNEKPLNLFFTTHSPNLASITPLSSIVLLKSSDMGTVGYSLASLELEDSVREDIERYLDVTKAEILFSKGVVFVEGDAEEALVPVFANTLGYDLDELGITVFNIGGTHFKSYVKFANALSLPYSIITDWDPQDDAPALGQDRIIEIIDLIKTFKGEENLTDAEKTELKNDDKKLKLLGEDFDIFTNKTTLETEIADTPELGIALLDIFEAENYGVIRKGRIKAWKNGEKPIDGEQLLAMVSDVGKGRLAARLARNAVSLEPPNYMKTALISITKHVSS